MFKLIILLIYKIKTFKLCNFIKFGVEIAIGIYN